MCTDWAYPANEGLSVPWEDIGEHPDLFVNSSEFSLPIKIVDPSSLNREQAFKLATYFLEFSTQMPHSPFVFRSDIAKPTQNMTSKKVKKKPVESEEEGEFFELEYVDSDESEDLDEGTEDTQIVVAGGEYYELMSFATAV